MPSIAIAQSAASAVLIAAPSEALAKIRVYNYAVAGAASGEYQFSDGTNVLTGPMGAFSTGGGASAGGGSKALFECGAGRPLQLLLTHGFIANGHLYYEVY